MGDAAGWLSCSRLVTNCCASQIWLTGGDGWAYDIGYGGLDHVLASARDVSVLVLVLDTGGKAMGLVASVAVGARDGHTLRAFLEAESHPGPSLTLAYSHCIAHGIDNGPGPGPSEVGGGAGSLASVPLWPSPSGTGRESPTRIDSRSNPRALVASMVAAATECGCGDPDRG